MKMWKTYVVAALAFFLCGIGAGHGQDIGDLDTSFGEGGKVITTFGRFGDQANAVALQADGKILAAGSASNGVDLDLAVARYNSDGTLDTSFSDDGKVRVSVGDGDEEISAIAVQDDGYIVAAGFTVIDGGRDFLLVRLNPNGVFDNSFGEGGIVITEFGNLNDEITAMAIDDEGRTVVCGYVTGTAGRVIAAARYQMTGELDSTFGDGGIVLTDIGDDALARDIAVDAEGRILLAGSYFHTNRTELMAVRFLDNGQIDREFGREGIAVPANREQPSDGYGISLREDGRIMVAGAVGKAGDQDAALFSFDGTGQPETSFGDNGVLVTSDNKEDDVALAIDVIDNVVGMSGYNTFNTKRDFLFVSVEETTDAGTNVALNSEAGGFVSGGRTYSSVFDLHGQEAGSTEGAGETTTNSVFSSTSMGYTDDLSYAVALQSDGKAVSVGSSVQDGVSRFAVARYLTPVASAAGGSVDTAVSWIVTREPNNVERTSAYSGGTIFADGLTIAKRGVVFSTAPDPIFDTATDGTNPPPDDTPGDGTGDTTPPTILTSSPTNGRIFNTGTTSVFITLTTNESATCRYSSTDTVYGSMTGFFDQTNTQNHSVTVTSEDDTSYTYFIRCQDLATNVNSSSYQISFSVDTGPVITGSTPSNGTTLDAGTTETIVTVTTDVNATCRLSGIAGTAFVDMLPFTTTGTTDHSVTVTVVEGDNDFYVRCQDDSATVVNEADYEIFFSVAAPAAAVRAPSQVPALYTKSLQVPSLNTSPMQVFADQEEEAAETSLAVTNGSPAGEIPSGSFMTYIGVYTSDRATCRFSAMPDLDYDSMPETMISADNLSHIGKVVGLMDDHSYRYYVRCRDFAGNENAQSYIISFRVASDDYVTRAYRMLRDIFGRFLVVNTAHAQTDTSTPDTGTTTTDTSNTPTSVFDLSAPSYSDEGFTEDGAGGGSFSSIMENLKPGTFYYVRAYAVDENNKVYYGNQYGFKTADSCFIATAAYGTLLHPYVKVLRSFRDRYLDTNVVGRKLVNLYYRHSPPIADYIASRPVVRGIVRIGLLPVVGMGWLVLHIGFTGVAMLAIFIILPSMLLLRSYRRLDTN